MAKKRAAIVPSVGASVFEMRDIDSLSPGDNQRKFFPGLEELAGLIEESGWVNTLEVNDDGTIIGGERRWRACKILNAKAESAGTLIPWPQLPCMVNFLDEKAAFQRNVAENMGRVDLRFIEISRIFKSYRDRYGFSDSQIGAKCGYSAETVHRYISILDRCHPDIIKRLDNGEQISVEFLTKIYTIRDKEIQLLRLNQWLGNPTEQTSEAAPSRERAAALSRRKMVALIKLLQQGNYQEETIQIAQFIAGMRNTLPNKLHLKLSRKQRQPRRD